MVEAGTSGEPDGDGIPEVAASIILGTSGCSWDLNVQNISERTELKAEALSPGFQPWMELCVGICSKVNTLGAGLLLGVLFSSQVLWPRRG